jgi:hypothetical protein
LRNPTSKKNKNRSLPPSPLSSYHRRIEPTHTTQRSTSLPHSFCRRAAFNDTIYNNLRRRPFFATASSSDLMASSISINAMALATTLGALPSQPLTRENALVWKALVIPALRGARVLDLVEGKDEAPDEFIEEEDARK